MIQTCWKNYLTKAEQGVYFSVKLKQKDMSEIRVSYERITQIIVINEAERSFFMISASAVKDFERDFDINNDFVDSLNESIAIGFFQIGRLQIDNEEIECFCYKTFQSFYNFNDKFNIKYMIKKFSNAHKNHFFMVYNELVSLRIFNINDIIEKLKAITYQ